jgi:anaerobic selenocysteine-containing dehydrogenase
MTVSRHKTTCTRDCPNSCSLVAVVEDGRLISLVGDPDAPTNQGRTCAKCARFVKRVYDPRRVLQPLRKKNGVFRPVGWPEALDELAERLRRTAELDPQRILYYQGFGARTALKLVNRRFFNLLGPTTVTKGTICGGAGQAAQDLDFGQRISHDLRDYRNSGALIVWGRNPAATSLNLVPVMKFLADQGRPVVLIDPVATSSARLCTWTLNPKPGSDSFLALALAGELLDAGAADLDFLENRCVGLEAYLRVVRAQSLEERAALCDVPARDVRALARLIMDHKPVGFVLGWGLHRWQRAHMTLRAIDALGATAGAIGVSGGGVSQGFEEYQPYDWDVWGDQLRPGRRKLFMPLLGQELEAADPPVEWALITAGNPVAMLPDANRVAAALAKVPFLAVAGHFLDDTALLADLFLPVTTFLEERDVVASYGHSWIGPLNQAIEPLGEAKSDFDLFMELGKRFDFAPEYVKSRDQWLRLIMRPTLEMGVSLEQIFEGGAYQRDIPHVPYQDRVFPTPSGKFQLLDSFEPPAEHEGQRAYQLMSTAPREWLCSEILEDEHPDCLPVFINSLEAEKLGLVEGELVELRSRFGVLKALTRLSPGLRRDLVVVPRGGWGRKGCNVNVLTKALLTEVGQGTAYYESRVDVKKI